MVSNYQHSYHGLICSHFTPIRRTPHYGRGWYIWRCSDSAYSLCKDSYCTVCTARWSSRCTPRIWMHYWALQHLKNVDSVAPMSYKNEVILVLSKKLPRSNHHLTTSHPPLNPHCHLPIPFFEFCVAGCIVWICYLQGSDCCRDHTGAFARTASAKNLQNSFASWWESPTKRQAHHHSIPDTLSQAVSDGGWKY